MIGGCAEVVFTITKRDAAAAAAPPPTPPPGHDGDRGGQAAARGGHADGRRGLRPARQAPEEPEERHGRHPGGGRHAHRAERRRPRVPSRRRGGGAPRTPHTSHFASGLLARSEPVHTQCIIRPRLPPLVSRSTNAARVGCIVRIHSCRAGQSCPREVARAVARS